MHPINPLTLVLVRVRAITTTTTMVAIRTMPPMTIPTMAPTAADPHKLPSWGEEVQPDGGGLGTAGARASGAAPNENSCS